MGRRPKGTTLDRIDNARGYEPGNVRWANDVQQNNNARSNRLISYEGRWRTIAEWARELGISYPALFERLKRWPVKRALTESSVPFKKRLLSYRGETHSIAEWARQMGMPYYRLLQRITVLGWSTHRALTESPKRRAR